MYCKQTQCVDNHKRYWGCYAFDLLTMPQILAKKALTLKECEDLIDAAIKRGIIQDNDIPITKEARLKWEQENGKPCPPWYRIYVANSLTFTKMVVDYLGGKGTLSEISRGAPTLPQPKDTRFVIIEWSTKTGSHFGLGMFINGVLETIYDPWESLPRTGVKTVRYWRYTE